MASSGTVKAKTKPSEWTTQIPMVDLDTVMKSVKDIHEKAMENAQMPAVAKALGYAGPTSSPFYKRVVAARLFGLLSQGASLTQAARDYIRPDHEGTKSTVLISAIRGIPQYIDLLNRYAGKKLNVELAANAIAKENNLTDACALVCAKVFEASINFAGMVNTDGSVQSSPVIGLVQPPIKERKDEPPPGREGEQMPPPKKESSPDTQEHFLYLDKNKDRQFSFAGPLEITRAEFDRICKWLEFTMIISDKETQT